MSNVHRYGDAPDTAAAAPVRYATKEIRPAEDAAPVLVTEDAAPVAEADAPETDAPTATEPATVDAKAPPARSSGR